MSRRYRSEYLRIMVEAEAPHVAVVIPCYRVADQILGVLARIGPEVTSIYVVDDLCPQKTGQKVQSQCSDVRVQVLFNDINQGVGGATIQGFLQARKNGAKIVVKVDGDGQMKPELIPILIRPILLAQADYVKGNRFFLPELLSAMPKIRLLGNAGLSFLAKVSTGYWRVMDPTNGFIGIHTGILQFLQLDKVDKRYFFETELLFRLNIVRAVIAEMPMFSVYGDEKSNLRIRNEVFRFAVNHFRFFVKRITYSYFVRDFNIGSIAFVLGLFGIFSGAAFALWHWYLSYSTGTPATAGTVMIAALLLVTGFQWMMLFLNYDISSEPKQPLNLISSA